MAFLGAAAITATFQLLGFCAACAMRTEMFYDVFGGLNFIALAAYSTLGQPGGLGRLSNRSLIITCAFIVSRAWLLLFLGWRAHARGGDSRFDPLLRPKKGPIRYGMFLVFWVAQGVWVYCLSAPMLFINNNDSVGPAPNEIFGSGHILDTLLFLGFAFGIAIEIIADIQKARWVAAGRQGGFCSIGVWSLSRHPNYFGEMLQWLCCWLLAYSSSQAGLSDPVWWATSVSPLFTFHILMNTAATGVAQANGKGLKRYYESVYADAYRKYRASTSILIPMVGYKYVPMWLKRTLFLDLERYEYRPRERKKSE